MLGDNGSALTYYLKSIQLQPKYAYGYIGAGGVYKKTKDFKSAKEVLEKGLKFAPTSKAMKDMLKGLE
jgi:hypothetical protein